MVENGGAHRREMRPTPMTTPWPFRIGRGPRRPRPRGIGPLGAAGAVAATIAIALLAIVTLGLALLLRPRRGTASGTASGGSAPGGGPGPDGGPVPAGDPAPPGAAAGTSKRRERSYAEIIEAWPVVTMLALGLSLAGV